MVQNNEMVLVGCSNIFYIYTIVFMTSDDRSDISAQETLGQNNLNNDLTCVSYLHFPAEQVQPFVCLGGQCCWEISEIPCVSPLHFLCFTTKLYSFQNCYWVCAQLPTVYSTYIYLYFISECFICFCKYCTTEVCSPITS